MGLNRKWFFTFGSVESTSRYSFTLSKKAMFLILGSTLLLASLIFFQLYGSFKYGPKKSEFKTLEKENLALKDKILEFSLIVDTVKSKLELIEEWEDQIRVERNFKPIESGLRDMGIGGYPQLDSLSSMLKGQTKLDYVLMSMRLKQLTARLDFDFSNFGTLRENIFARADMYDNTPTIYPTFGYISSGYGYRDHPILRARLFHSGIDIVNKTGTPVHSTANGLVTRVVTVDNSTLGKYIRIKHKFGYETYYAHLSKTLVKKGQSVAKGQIIGLMGNTGRSTGSHLHYEIRRYRATKNPISSLTIQQDNLVIAK